MAFEMIFWMISQITWNILLRRSAAHPDGLYMDHLTDLFETVSFHWSLRKSHFLKIICVCKVQFFYEFLFYFCDFAIIMFHCEIANPHVFKALKTFVVYAFTLLFFLSKVYKQCILWGFATCSVESKPTWLRPETVKFFHNFKIGFARNFIFCER